MTAQELTDAGYEEVCDLAEIGARPTLVEVGGREILLCADGGAYYALDSICPHENQSMKFGFVLGGEITCPHHQYRFKLDTGKCNRACAPLEVYDLEVCEDRIWVRVR